MIKPGLCSINESIVFDYQSPPIDTCIDSLWYYVVTMIHMFTKRPWLWRYVYCATSRVGGGRLLAVARGSVGGGRRHYS